MKLLHALLVYLLINTAALAVTDTVTLDVSRASMRTLADTVPPGGSVWVKLEITPETGWHSYWQNPGDSGLATTIDWQLPPGVTAGVIQWPTPHRIPIPPLVNYGYEGKVTLWSQIHVADTIKNGGTLALKANATWLVCLEQCIPQSGSFTLNMTVDSSAKLMELPISERQQWPVALATPVSVQQQDGVAILTLPVADLPGGVSWNWSSGYFFITQANLVAHNQPQTMQQSGDALAVHLPLLNKNKPLPAGIDGVFTVQSQDSGSHGNPYAFSIRATVSPSVVTSKPATPVHTPNTTPENMGLMAAIGLAVLGGLLLNLMPCVFPVLSLKALAVAKARDGERKHLLQEALAYSAGILLSFIALSLVLTSVKVAGKPLGWGFQLQEPAVVAGLTLILFAVGLMLSGFLKIPGITVSANFMSEHSLKSSFLTGLLVVLLATPCTAPFMAPAIGYALTQPSTQAIAIFAALGVGLALPYILVCMLPAMQRLLPRPGAWMETFKQLLAFPMYASALWLLWVYGLQTSIPAVMHLLAAALAITFLCWLAPRLRKKWLWLLLVIVITGFFWQMRPAYNVSEQLLTKDEATVKALDSLLASGQPVFVNVTAAWCITCQVNGLALESDAVKQAFTHNNVRYIVLDWTRRDDDIYQYLQRFSRSGVPLYVYYPGAGKAPVVLPQILTVTGVLSAVD